MGQKPRVERRLITSSLPLTSDIRRAVGMPQTSNLPKTALVVAVAV